MRQIHSEKGGFAVCEYCSKEFTGSIGKVKFALKEHIQVRKEYKQRILIKMLPFRRFTWVSERLVTNVEKLSSQILC